MGKPPLNWSFQPFHNLSLAELYQICAARQEVFVVGQALNYVDCDGKDPTAWHLQGRDATTDELICYLRVLPPELKYPDAYAIGRVLTRPDWQRQGYGKALMQEALRQLATTFGSIQVRMAAQAYLEAFYQTFGFHTMSEPFYEEGLLHVTMNRQLTVPS